MSVHYVNMPFSPDYIMMLKSLIFDDGILLQNSVIFLAVCSNTIVHLFHFLKTSGEICHVILMLTFSVLKLKFL